MTVINQEYIHNRLHQALDSPDITYEINRLLAETLPYDTNREEAPTSYHEMHAKRFEDAREWEEAANAWQGAAIASNDQMSTLCYQRMCTSAMLLGDTTWIEVNRKVSEERDQKKCTFCLIQGEAND